MRSPWSADTRRPTTSTGWSPGGRQRIAEARVTGQPLPQPLGRGQQRGLAVHLDGQPSKPLGSRLAAQSASSGSSEVSSSSESMSERGRRSGQWREQDSNLRRQSQCVYSASPLTARESRQAGAESSVGYLGARGSPGSIFELGVLRSAKADADPPPSAVAGMYHRRPSPTCTNSRSQREASRRLMTRSSSDSRHACRAQQRTGRCARRRRLDLNSLQRTAQISDQVVVRAVEHRHRDHGACTEQPRDRRELANVPLLPRIPLSGHDQNIRSGPDRKSVLLQSCHRTVTKRPAAAAPRAAPRASSACGSRSGGSARG